MTIEYYQSKGKWWWRLRGSNGAIICRSEFGSATQALAIQSLKDMLDAGIDHYDFLVTGFTE